jgi:uncharacterized protein YbjT (DUF2867 family)
MILVAGGTGRLGSELVRRLTVQGERVRVLTRDPARAAHLTGAEGVVGDVRNPADLSAAVQDVAAVVSAITGFIWRGPRHTGERRPGRQRKPSSELAPSSSCTRI